MPLSNPPPLSLYIHIPWCVRKCPYCDFNSHAASGNLPEELYIRALLAELDSLQAFYQDRSIVSIFFGGGTPSLFSAKAIAAILEGAAKRLTFAPNIEITLEANPGTVDQSHFQGFYASGVNRLSLGVQSLDDNKLTALGRIHNSQSALAAIHAAKRAGFSNFNIDIMHGLPNQTLEQALSDIKLALACEPTHFSWYQLTIEPNTFFHYQPPALPSDDTLWEIQLAGFALIAEHGFKQYEVSAYAKAAYQCQHNRNYWEFGDYIGIGAGAHSKLTDSKTGKVWRYAQVKHPKDYLDLSKRQAQIKEVKDKDLLFECMLNALRLTDGIPLNFILSRTGTTLAALQPTFNRAIELNLLSVTSDRIYPTAHGMRYLNDLVSLFLP